MSTLKNSNLGILYATELFEALKRSPASTFGDELFELLSMIQQVLDPDGDQLHEQLRRPLNNEHAKIISKAIEKAEYSNDQIVKHLNQLDKDKYGAEAMLQLSDLKENLIPHTSSLRPS